MTLNDAVKKMRGRPEHQITLTHGPQGRGAADRGDR
jgi:C-terminal processing protease CtpA/Prc